MIWVKEIDGVEVSVEVLGGGAVSLRLDDSETWLDVVLEAEDAQRIATELNAGAE